MPAGRYPTQMLQFGWMKPADAAALFTYIRSNFGNSAPPVDAATVARALRTMTPPTTIHTWSIVAAPGDHAGGGRAAAVPVG